MKLAAPAVIIPTERDCLAYGGDPIAMQMERHHYGNKRRRGSGGAFSTIALVNTAIDAGAGTNSDVTVSLPTGLSQDDLVIFALATGDNTNRTYVVSGWTQIADLFQSDSRNVNFWVGYKKMGVSPDTTVTFTNPTDSDGGWAYAAMAFSGVDTTTPIDVTPTTATSGNSVLANPPSITPSTAQSLIVALGGGGHNNGSSVSYSSSELSDFITDAGNDVSDAVVGMGWSYWEGGAFNPAAFSYSTSDSTSNSWAACTVALRPA